MKRSIPWMGVGSLSLGLLSIACTASTEDSVEPEVATHIESLRAPGHRRAPPGGHHHRPRVCHGNSGGAGGTGDGGPSTDGGGTGGGPSADACALVVEDGALSSECSNVVGYFYTYVDEGYSSIAPSEYGEDTDGSVCASGTAAQVIDEQYDVYWGAGVGVDLAPEIDGAPPYDAAADGVTGFGFTITGVPLAGELRFDVHDAVDDSIYCTPVMPLHEGYNEISFADLAKNCWAPEPETPDVTQLARLQWQVVTNTATAFDYDFCISELVALR